MKQSKTSFVYVILGLITFLTSFALFVITGSKQENNVMIAIGLSGMAILWIMGIQSDLYELEGKKKDG